MLSLQSGDLIRLVEIGESGIPPCKSEASRASRHRHVAEFRRGEVERGALEAERALEAGIPRREAGGEQPSEG